MHSTIEWHLGTPTECGWYLGAVNFDQQNPDSLTTIMLWYNPQSTGKWYYGCGVGGKAGVDYDDSQALNGRWGKKYAVVKFWTKKPNFYG